jgi:hypothetical protein
VREREKEREMILAQVAGNVAQAKSLSPKRKDMIRMATLCDDMCWSLQFPGIRDSLLIRGPSPPPPPPPKTITFLVNPI